VAPRRRHRPCKGAAIRLPPRREGYRAVLADRVARSAAPVALGPPEPEAAVTVGGACLLCGVDSVRLPAAVDRYETGTPKDHDLKDLIDVGGSLGAARKPRPLVYRMAKWVA
jgi:hypothetical protein